MKRFLLALFVLLPTLASAQVTFDANATASCTANAVTSITCSTLTVGSGSNRALTCQTAWGGANGGVSSYHWDELGTPQNLALVTSASATNTVQVEIWALVAPTSGAKQAKIVWTTAKDIIINCLSYTGVDQTGGTTSFAHGNGATGTSTGPAVTITSATNNAVVAAHAADTSGGGSFTATNNTNTFINNTPATMGGAGNRAAGASSVSMTATIDVSKTWASAGADIVAAGGGTPACKNGLLMLGVGCDDEVLK